MQQGHVLAQVAGLPKLSVKELQKLWSNVFGEEPRCLQKTWLVRRLAYRLQEIAYTRKSTEEGLEQEFNSLDAQREAGEAYVASQRHEGWTLVPDYYDDGGFSGGSMGGSPPYGYDVIERRLVINEVEAAVVRKIFQRFLVLRSTTKLTEELRQEGCLTKSYVTGSGRHKQGRLMDKGFLYKLLSNPVYLGEIRHRDQVYPGQHTAIIERTQWLEVRRIMEENPTARGNMARTQNPALLRGLIRCGGCDSGMTPTHPPTHDGMADNTAITPPTLKSRKPVTLALSAMSLLEKWKRLSWRR